MPFTPDTKNTGDFVSSGDWNGAMEAIVALFEKFSNGSAAHNHTGGFEEGPQLGTSSLLNGAVTDAKIANSTISGSKLRNNTLTGSKLANGTVTLSKIASGVIPPNIGITVSKGLSDGQTIPVPSGFSRSECIFFASIKYLNLNMNASGSVIYSCNVDSNGKIATSPTNRVAVMAFAIGKKGGW